MRNLPRQPFIGLALAAVAGVALADRLPFDVAWCAGAALAAGAAALFCRPCAWLCVAAAFAALHTAHDRESPARRLAAEVGGGRAGVEAVGVVDDAPNARENGASFPLRLESVTLRGVERPARARVMVSCSDAAPRYGDRVRLRGLVRNVPPPRNPGQFDQAAHLRRAGIFSQITTNRANGMEVLASGAGNPVFAFALRTRAWMQATLRRGLEDAPEISGLMQSMVLGITEETTPETQDLFRMTGTLHLFAVSGLNVAMLAFIAWMVVRPLGLGRGRSMLVVIPLVLFYAVVTGLTPSGVRAAIMTVIVLAGFIVERPAHALNSLAAAAFLILLWDTNQLFATGFQLSFGVVLALLLLGGPLQRRALRLVQPDPFLPRSLMSAWQRTAVAGAEAGAAFVAVSLAAWLGSLPLGLWYFHMLPPVAVLANFVAVPLAFVVMAAGMMAFAAAPFSSWLVAVCNNANWLVTKIILGAMAFCAALPGGHFYVGFRKMNAPPVEITVFDFGDGGGIHLRCDGRDWLVDCGRERDFRWTLQPYLRMRGVNRLDGLVLTHGDAGHIGAACEVAGEYRPAQVVDSPLKDRSPNRRALAGELHGRGSGRAIVWSGDTLTLADGVRLRVLHPPADVERRTADDKALVLLLEAHGCRVLLMSDGGFITEKWLLEHDAVPRCDVLVKGLHGHDISGTAEFLARVRPAVLVTACDEFKPDAGLAPGWCADVRSRGIGLFRQDETGAVTVRVWPEKWEASAFLGGQTFTSRAR